MLKWYTSNRSFLGLLPSLHNILNANEQGLRPNSKHVLDARRFTSPEFWGCFSVPDLYVYRLYFCVANGSATVRLDGSQSFQMAWTLAESHTTKYDGQTLTRVFKQSACWQEETKMTLYLRITSQLQQPGKYCMFVLIMHRVSLCSLHTWCSEDKQVMVFRNFGSASKVQKSEDGCHFSDIHSTIY